MYGLGFQIHVLIEGDHVAAILMEVLDDALIDGGCEVDVVVIVVTDEDLDGKRLLLQTEDTATELLYLFIVRNENRYHGATFLGTETEA